VAYSGQALFSTLLARIPIYHGTACVVPLVRAGMPLENESRAKFTFNTLAFNTMSNFAKLFQGQKSVVKVTKFLKAQARNAPLQTSG